MTTALGLVVRVRRHRGGDGVAVSLNTVPDERLRY